MRVIGLAIHRTFAQVAILEDGVVKTWQNARPSFRQPREGVRAGLGAVARRS